MLPVVAALLVVHCVLPYAVVVAGAPTAPLTATGDWGHTGTFSDNAKGGSSQQAVSKDDRLGRIVGDDDDTACYHMLNHNCTTKLFIDLAMFNPNAICLSSNPEYPGTPSCILVLVAENDQTISLDIQQFSARTGQVESCCTTKSCVDSRSVVWSSHHVERLSCSLGLLATLVPGYLASPRFKSVSLARRGDTGR